MELAGSGRGTEGVEAMAISANALQLRNIASNAGIRM